MIQTDRQAAAPAQPFKLFRFQDDQAVQCYAINRYETFYIKDKHTTLKKGTLKISEYKV